MASLNRDNASYLALMATSFISVVHLSWMAYNGTFTFSLLGMIFILVNTLNAFIEYLSTITPEEKLPAEREPDDNYDFDQYRQLQQNQRQRLNRDPRDIGRATTEPVHIKCPSSIATILQFCSHVLSTSFFTTDLFFAYQVFEPDLNYLPLLGGALNIIPAIYISDGIRQRDLFVFTVPANCWGQVYIVGIKQHNYYAILAGYIFFLAFYYIHVQRSNFGITAEAYANYHLVAYCVLGSTAVAQAFSNFDMKTYNYK